MYIITLALPTPKRIVKKLKNFFAVDRCIIYAVIGVGIITIYFGDYPVKIFPISALIYYAIVFELIKRDIIVLPESNTYNIPLQYGLNSNYP